MSLFDTLLYRSPKPMICFRCKKNKKPSEFHRDSSAKRGYAASCRECKRKPTLQEPYKDLTLSVKIEEDNGFIPETDISEYGKRLMSGNQDIEAFGRVCEALMKKFGRSIMLKVEKDMKSELRVYGLNHKEQFRGKKPQDIIDRILG